MEFCHHWNGVDQRSNGHLGKPFYLWTKERLCLDAQKKSVFHIQKTGATYSNSLRMRRFQPIPPPSSSWNSCSQHPLHTSSLVSPRPKRPKSPLPVAKRLPSSVSTTVCCASAMLRAQLTGNFISKSSWAHPSSSKHNHGILFFVGETWGPGGPKSLAVV